MLRSGLSQAGEQVCPECSLIGQHHRYQSLWIWKCRDKACDGPVCVVMQSENKASAGPNELMRSAVRFRRISLGGILFDLPHELELEPV